MTNSLSPRTFVSRDESACTRMLGVIHLTPYTLLHSVTGLDEHSRVIYGPRRGPCGEDSLVVLARRPMGVAQSRATIPVLDRECQALGDSTRLGPLFVKR